MQVVLIYLKMHRNVYIFATLCATDESSAYHGFLWQPGIFDQLPSVATLLDSEYRVNVGTFATNIINIALFSPDQFVFARPEQVVLDHDHQSSLIVLVESRCVLFTVVFPLLSSHFTCHLSY